MLAFQSASLHREDSRLCNRLAEQWEYQKMISSYENSLLHTVYFATGVPLALTPGPLSTQVQETTNQPILQSGATLWIASAYFFCYHHVKNTCTHSTNRSVNRRKSLVAWQTYPPKLPVFCSRSWVKSPKITGSNGVCLKKRTALRLIDQSYGNQLTPARAGFWPAGFCSRIV